MNPAVSLLHISKSFPGVNALREVSFDVRSGEVHALMGENGAGKSTLMKILAGVYQPDAGVIRVGEQEVRFRSPKEAIDAGTRMIFQELTTLPNMDVGRNILLGREPRRGGVVDEKALYRKAQEILHSLQLDIPVRTKVEELSIGQQQMVEIARAIEGEPKVMVMDEPTSSLGRHEDEALFALIERLKSRGVAIIYISHRMEEVLRIADRITVLRDGQYVGTKERNQVNEAGLIEMMIGRKLESRSRQSNGPLGKVVLEVKHLSRPPRVQDVSFKLHQGEVLGLAGLVGAGRTETARLIFGVDKPESGEIYLEGQAVRFHSPEQAIAQGIVYVPEDRKHLGLILMHSIRNNLALPSLKHFNRLGVVDQKGVLALVEDFVKRLRVKTPSIEQTVELLSGGNQQKVVLAKWLATKPKVLILDEPTRGIDVNAKTEVYELVRRVAGEGVAVLLISSETPEILRESDRIVVVHQGRIAGDLEAAGATEKQVVGLSFGQKDEA